MVRIIYERNELYKMNYFFPAIFSRLHLHNMCLAFIPEPTLLTIFSLLIFHLAGECQANVCAAGSPPAYNQGNSTSSNTITSGGKAESSVVSVESNSLANGACHHGLTVSGDNGKPICKGPCSPNDLSSPSPTENNKYDLFGNIPTGKVTYKPTTWLLAECQNGKVVREPLKFFSILLSLLTIMHRWSFIYLHTHDITHCFLWFLTLYIGPSW